MHIYYKQAAVLIKKTTTELNRLLSCDGEDISYYDSSILDEHINNLINAKVLMACASEDKIN